MSKKTVPFEKASYRSQVRRLRALAESALKLYPIKVKAIDFVNHGENATFKVTDHKGSQFLLRAHRNDYHSLPGLQEELTWLAKLAKAGVLVPRPFASKKKNLIEKVAHEDVGSRYCDVFNWIDGKFLSKSISETDMYEIGKLLAKIQSVGKRDSKHRKYWHADGLVGKEPKFGSIDELSGLRKDHQSKITKARKQLLSRLKRYQSKNPHKMGIIHADLHFGNLLKTKSQQIAAIDFDDSGFGFYIYDLVIPLMGLEHHLKDHKRFHLYPKMKSALLEGYTSIKAMDKTDHQVLQDLILARKLLMLGWLQSRSDNPKLKGRVAKYAQQTLKYIKKPYL
jgi:Ser/Thr protein kinase RdoA (MazF antagonist)